MNKYDIKKLLKKYNKILSKQYEQDYKLIESEGIKGSIEAIENLQYDCWSDSCDTYKECDYIKKYLYFKYIEKDIENFMEEK